MAIEVFSVANDKDSADSGLTSVAAGVSSVWVQSFSLTKMTPCFAGM